jgi:hypothetical protein
MYASPHERAAPVLSALKRVSAAAKVPNSLEDMGKMYRQALRASPNDAALMTDYAAVLQAITGTPAFTNPKVLHATFLVLLR